MPGAARLLLTLVLLAVLPALSGCGTLQAYPGPRQRPVALLKPAARDVTHVVLEAVGGRRLGVLQDRAEVLPGLCAVAASVVLDTGERFLTSRHQLEFTAEAGQEYTVRADWYVYGARLIIEDRDGRLVAEDLPPRANPPAVYPRRSTVFVPRRHER